VSRLLPPGAFFGEIRRFSRVGEFVLSESSYGNDTRIATHAHENAFFYYVLKGSASERSQNRTRETLAGALVFHPAGACHSNHWTTAGYCLHLELSPTILARAREMGAALDQPAEFHGGWPTWIAARIHQELEIADSVAPLALEGLALELLAVSSRAKDVRLEQRSQLWLRKAEEFLHEHFAEQPTLAEIAVAAGVHPSHLARTFRKVLKCSIGDYIRALRIEFACRELTHGNRSLAQIAQAAGFSDQSHFSRCFRQCMRMTPAAFRRGSGRSTTTPES
jgi:AraC family transcriptional regulator